jgi:hypothetical protein
MKLSNILALVCLALISTNAFATSSIQNEEIGQIVAVKRTFKADLDDCGARYKASDATYGLCGVKVTDGIDADFETIIKSFIHKKTFQLASGQSLTVQVMAGKTAYMITVQRSHSGEMDFTGIKGYIQATLNEINWEIPITVQTIKPVR